MIKQHIYPFFKFIISEWLSNKLWESSVLLFYELINIVSILFFFSFLELIRLLCVFFSNSVCSIQRIYWLSDFIWWLFRCITCFYLCEFNWQSKQHLLRSYYLVRKILGHKPLASILFFANILILNASRTFSLPSNSAYKLLKAFFYTIFKFYFS